MFKVEPEPSPESKNHGVARQDEGVEMTRAAGTQTWPVALVASLAALAFALTGCGASEATPDHLDAAADNPATPPTLQAPSGIGSTETGQSGGDTPTAHETEIPAEKLQIAGNWGCRFGMEDGSARANFTITEDGNGGWRMSRKGGYEITLPVDAKDNTIVWYGDTANNPAGWDVTINLLNGSMDGASGSYLNHYNNTTRPITDCKPFQYARS